MTLALSGAAGFFLHRRELRAVWRRGHILPAGRSRHRIGCERRRRAHRFDHRPAVGRLLLGGGTSASGVVQYMVPFAALAGAAVFGLSYCRRPQELIGGAFIYSVA